MPSPDNDATPPRSLAPSDLERLSRAGRVLFSAVEQRLFGGTDAPRLGRYHVLEALGQGAMGIVYKAYDPQLDRRVAIKVVTLSGAEARERMVREAKALAKLNHPNIVTVHEVGEDGEDSYVVMEYVDGGTLQQWADAHPKGERGRTASLIGFAEQALRGLAAAHDLGVVHRDIKPANMLVGRDGRLRIADFGLASGGHEQDVTLVTQAAPGKLASGTLSCDGELVGTPAFMAPEQFRGTSNAQSDLFSVAVSFFLLLYGRRPFPTGGSLSGLVDAVESGDIVVPDAGDVPNAIRRVLLRALRPSGIERFADARAMATALGAARGRRGRLLTAVGLGVAAAAAVVTAAASEPRPCTDERARAEAVVAAHKSRIDGLIQDSPWPRPDELSEGFSNGLNEMVDRWATQTLDACKAARVREPERAELAQQQLACLDDGLAAAASMLEEIDGVTLEQARRLPTIAVYLRDIVDCDKPDHNTFARTQGRELLATLRTGQIAESRLEFARADALFESILGATPSGELPELRIEAQVRLVASAYERGDLDAVRRHAMGALEDADSADSGWLALAWLQVAETLPPDTPDAAFDVLMQRSRAARMRRPLSDAMLAAVGYREAGLWVNRGKLDKAADVVAEALGPAERVESHLIPFLYVLESQLALQGGDLDRAKSRAQDAVSVSIARLGEHHPQVVAPLKQLGDIQSWQGDDKGATETLSRGIEIADEFPQTEPTLLYALLSDRGDAFRNLLRFDEALLDLARATKVAESIADGRFRLDTARESTARVYWAMERPEDALAQLEPVLVDPGSATVYERMLRANAALLRVALLADLDRDKEVIESMPQVETWVAEAFPGNGVARVQAAAEVAEVWNAVGEFERAYAELDAFLPTVDDDPMWRGRLQRTRAEGLGEEGRKDEARVWAERALASMKQSSAGEHEYAPIRELLAELGAAPVTKR